jgi:hypothetical protein
MALETLQGGVDSLPNIALFKGASSMENDIDHLSTLGGVQRQQGALGVAHIPKINEEAHLGIGTVLQNPLHP